MKKLNKFFMLLLAVICIQITANADPLPLLSYETGNSETPVSTVTLCHHTSSETNPWVMIEVNEDAENAHLNHGDGYPGECVPGTTGFKFDANCVVMDVSGILEICDNGIDDNCDGQIDEADGIYDNVCDADCLELGISTSFSNVGATVQEGEVDPGPGTGQGATCNAINGWCNIGAEPIVNNSVWFKFVAPPSGCVDVSALDADLQIAVWSATDCSDFGTFSEIGANDDSGPGFAPFLDNLPVIPGVTYLVQIDGYQGAIEDAGQVLVRDCFAPIPECEAATEIFCGDIIVGSTIGGTTIFDLTSCGTTLNTSPGVWYKLLGLGDDVTLATCGATTDYDTKIGVFTGECNLATLVCIGGNDDACPGFKSTFTFNALSGVEYFIYVTGFSSAQGTYELTVDCSSPDLFLSQGSGQVEQANLTTQLESFGEDTVIGKLYPNPANSISNLEVSVIENTSGIIQIFDHLGRLAYQKQEGLYTGYNTIEMNLQDLSNGTYFVKVTIGQQMFHKKLIMAK